MMGSPGPSPRSRCGPDGQRLADVDGTLERPVDADMVGEILFETLDRFDQSFGQILFAHDVIARVVGHLLSVVAGGQMTPAALAFVLAHAAGDQVGQNRGADALDAGNGAARMVFDVPLVFELGEHLFHQLLGALIRVSFPRRAEVFDFLQGQQGLADLVDSLDERLVVSRLPGESLLQFIEHRLQRFVEVALERITNRDGNDHDLAGLAVLLQAAWQPGGR